MYCTNVLDLARIRTPIFQFPRALAPWGNDWVISPLIYNAAVSQNLSGIGAGARVGPYGGSWRLTLIEIEHPMRDRRRSITFTKYSRGE